MNGDDRLQGDNLEEALGRLQGTIRSEPAEPKHRIYLFQLLAVLGRWDRALNQLNVLEELDKETIPMVGTYRQAIQCEALRREIFAGERSPVIFGEPEEWTAFLLESLRLAVGGNHAEAEDMRARAFEGAPATSGTLDGEPFEWIADADSRLGPVLEVILNGKYVWVPFNRIAKVDVVAPVDMRDLVWMPAHFTWSNGGELVGLIPTRYPGTETSEEPQHLMARKTDWIEVGSATYLGRGQRMLTTDNGDHALMDIREIELDTVTGDESGGSDRG